MGSSSKLSCAFILVGEVTSSLVANTLSPSSPVLEGSTAGERVVCGVSGLLPEWLDARVLLARVVSMLVEGEDEPWNLLKDFVFPTLGLVVAGGDVVAAMIPDRDGRMIRDGLCCHCCVVCRG